MLYFTVRLVDGSSKYEGRVEVYYDGKWGKVCNSEWDFSDAQVVCNELDFGFAFAILTSRSCYQSSNITCLDDVMCVGTESAIGECSHKGWGSENCLLDNPKVSCSAGNITGKHTYVCI